MAVLDYELFYDDAHHRYLVQKLDRTEQKRIQQIMLHVALYNGKIWIEEDWTEEDLATVFWSMIFPTMILSLASSRRCCGVCKVCRGVGGIGNLISL